ncbi:STAS domain-containing protein [Bowmanella sp. Y26]|uniref:STAS domain-containing protein n=1 Tax=Bowmanella yangjiangensis TaxID=2811230 RepID=UPI001BDC0C5A|nr:STAS domain-containing protein [Bowmanella yangjiangensis]MBT1062048.1 STAS domain-containing protein [Bowmanella yangjiangensis]
MSALNIEFADSPGVCRLVGSLTLDYVMDLEAQQSALWQHKQLTLDLADLQQSDMAGLAWLVRLVGEARQRGVSMRFTNPPDTLLKLAKISDVDKLLPLE